MKVEALRIAVNIPLVARECKTRGLPDGTSSLVVQAREARDDFQHLSMTLAEAVFECKRRAGSIYLSAIHPFTSLDASRAMMDAAGLESLDVAGWWTAKCPSVDGLARVFRSDDYEELAILDCTSDAEALRILRTVDADRDSGTSHNAAFVMVCGEVSGCAFYAPSHRSLEVLGSLEFLAESWLPVVTESLLRRQSKE